MTTEEEVKQFTWKVEIPAPSVLVLIEQLMLYFHYIHEHAWSIWVLSFELSRVFVEWLDMQGHF